MKMSRSVKVLKNLHVRSWLLMSSFAKFQRFWSSFLLFQVLFCSSPAVHEGHVQLTLLGSLCFPVFFWIIKNIVFVFFLIWNRQTGFPLIPIVSKGSQFFVLFVGDDGPLNLNLHVVALPVSVTMQRPSKTTWKLNTWGRDFSVLVLQSSNSSDLNAFFSSFVSFFLSVHKGHIQVRSWESFCSTIFFSWLKIVFLSFLSSEIFKLFSR